jgi:chromosome segregation ATPase
MYRESLMQLQAAAEVVKKFKKDYEVVMGLNELVTAVRSGLEKLDGLSSQIDGLEKRAAQAKEEARQAIAVTAAAEERREKAQRAYDALVAETGALKKKLEAFGSF